ncbi:MAG TPA: tRNA 2-thiouridine(34) synthase MnmA [Longimicrobiales bacterium]|nr:tRNA 2-thiouridine(34) synthase MnmA [Longimicrobiales bacterium]
MDATKGRVLVAMSGGVDSSVAAALLVQEGWEVVGATMKTFCYSETPAHGKTCCGLDGIADARRVADRLGVPHYVFDVEEDFTRDVMDDFVSEYARGRTPNPCVRCNSNTKFRDLMRRGELLGCDAIASGHYARMRHGDGGPSLHRGMDAAKDQAYVLWGLPRELLPRLRLPLGALTKSRVRERARSLGLATADKAESQEICFVPTGDYRDLLEKRLAPRHPALEPGPLVDLDGNVVGEHEGYGGFTVGQRRGLGGGFPEPMYVVQIRPGTREVVVGPARALEAEGVEVAELNWLAEPPGRSAPVTVQCRYRAPGVPARIVEHREGRLRLVFLDPQRAVTPGQSAVLFRGSRVLGGGRIVGPLPPRDQPTGSAPASISFNSSSERARTSPSASDLSAPSSTARALSPGSDRHRNTIRAGSEDP